MNNNISSHCVFQWLNNVRLAFSQSTLTITLMEFIKDNGETFWGNLNRLHFSLTSSPHFTSGQLRVCWHMPCQHSLQSAERKTIAASGARAQSCSATACEALKQKLKFYWSLCLKYWSFLITCMTMVSVSFFHSSQVQEWTRSTIQIRAQPSHQTEAVAEDESSQVTSTIQDEHVHVDNIVWSWGLSSPSHHWHH